MGFAVQGRLIAKIDKELVPIPLAPDPAGSALSP